MIFLSKKLKTFLLNSVLLTLSSIIFRALGIFLTSYITKKVGKETLGLFSLVMSVYIFGITLGNFGMNLASTRLVSEELAIGNIEGVKKIAKRCIFLSFCLGTMAGSIFLVFSNFIVKFCLHNKVEKNVVYLISMALPFISMSSAISGYFIAVRRVHKSSITQFFEQVIKIAVTAFALNLFLPNAPEYACFSLILGDLISEIFSFLCNYILYARDSKIYKTSYSTSHAPNYYNRQIFKIALPVAVTSFIRSGLATLKQILIPISFEKSALDCKTALSIYGEINGMSMPIVVFPNVIFSSISSLFVPEFASYNAQGRHKQIRKITRNHFANFHCNFWFYLNLVIFICRKTKHLDLQRFINFTLHKNIVPTCNFHPARLRNRQYLKRLGRPK